MLLSCSKQPSQGSFVARVDQEFLTEQELASSLDTLRPSGEQEREVITQWVDNELLYLEARRRGLEKSDELRREIEAATRKLVIGRLLDQELYREENVSEDEIVTLYNGGGEALRLHEDVVNASYALFSDRDEANSFRGRLVRGMPWNVALEELQRDSLLRSHLLQIATRQYFTQSNLYPPELWRLARNLGKDEVSFAAKTDAGYYIFVGHSVKKQGELPDLDYIRDELRNRILIEHRRLRYEKLLSELRAKHAVEVHLPEPDTSSQVIE
jgi:peptidyl-prolyl cis-trans isomerase C